MTSPSTSRLLLVVPAYCESQRLPAMLDEALQVLTSTPVPGLELRVCDDGSKDSESQGMRQAVQSRIPAFQAQGVKLAWVRHDQNRGKGGVLREHFIDAMGPSQSGQAGFEYVGFADADGATPFHDVLRVFRSPLGNPTWGGTIGSRWKCLGFHVERTWKRHASGRIFATLVSELFQIPVYDSQCGAKFYRVSELQKHGLEPCTDPRWLFDTQLLIWMFLKGAQIREIPVNWADQPGSKVSLLRDSWRMFVGLWTYRKRLSQDFGLKVTRTLGKE